ncbi:type I restriction-modification system subunit M/S [Vibrio apostichopi]|uniref:N-6 DNA methylase n=1 Tax=Vibrio apostichopi TaxID=3035453 RepID=UPI0025724C0F|nr:type I restriction-modification system subunit M/S [Vibrio sp. FE10]
MQVEATMNSERIQAEFWDFADGVRNNGRPIKDSFLSAFTILLASQNFNRQSTKLDDPSTIHNAVYELLSTLNLTKQVLISNVLDLNFEHPSLHRFLFTCNSLELSNQDFVDTLDWIISYSDINLSDSSTPPEVAELMIKLAQVEENESILDPAMGVAGFYRALRAKDYKTVSFTGIEINVKSFFISSLYQYLFRDKNSTLHRSSAFSPHLSSLTNSFDVILCNPPVQRLPLSEAQFRYQERLGYQVISSEMSLNFVALGLQNIRLGGRAVFLINMRPLFVGGELQEIRRHWVNSGMLKSVISLPSKLLAHTGLKCAILVFKKNSDSSHESDRKIKFVKSDDCFHEAKKGKRFLSSEDIKDITRRVLHVNDGSNASSVDVTLIKDNEYSLVPEQYMDRDIAGINLSLSKIWKPIGDMAEILRGGSFAKLKDGNEPIIQGRDLRVEKLSINELESKELADFGKPIRRTQACDILLQRIGDKPAAYFITTEEGIAVADTVFILRFKGLKAKTIRFICQFINSEEGYKRIGDSSSYSVVQTQSIKSIRSIKVPVPDEKVVSLVEEMNAIEAALRAEYQKAAQLRIALFGGFDQVDLSTNIKKVKLASQVLKNALSQKDDINYKVKSLYPFPLAYPYRNIYAEREYAAIYDRQMKYGELLISFLASLGLSLLYEYKEHINEPLNEVSSLLTEGLVGGLSPGHWRQILKKSCTVLRSVEDAPLAEDFSSMWFKGRGKKESEFATSTNKHIVEPLNNFKHGRGPVNSHEYKELGKKQTVVISRLLEEVEFLSQCEIVLIDSIDTEWATGNTTYSASLLRGDHPAFESIVFESDERLSREKLYIRHNSKFISLYPFLSCLYNPKTKKAEIFSFDKRRRDGLILKSFDSGTSIECHNVDADLNFWLGAVKGNLD